MGCAQLIALVLALLVGGLVLLVLRGLVGLETGWAALIALLIGGILFIFTVRTVRTV